jgi:site-specific DNA recombinase
VVHHILSEPVYTGTTYANRYDLVEAKKPRSRQPSYSGKGCRRIRPREQGIAIPVPAIIEQGLGDRAQAQLARNAKLSFRNNQKHHHLLRCLLTCSACGLAMHGVARTLAGGVARNYYRCAGKDRVMTAREVACPRAHLDGEQLETTVWEHIRALLVDPAQLLAQFERFASGTDQEARHARPSSRSRRGSPGWPAPIGVWLMRTKPRRSALRSSPSAVARWPNSARASSVYAANSRSYAASRSRRRRCCTT